jgi:drug/metabolite transporter (DMT)-like permease
MVAIAFLGEHISTLGAAGIAGVVLGVFFIAGGPALLRPRSAPKPGCACAAACCMAC